MLSVLNNHYNDIKYNISIYEFTDDISNTEKVINYIKNYHIITTKQNRVDVKNIQEIRNITKNEYLFSVTVLKDGRLAVTGKDYSNEEEEVSDFCFLKIYDSSIYYHCSIKIIMPCMFGLIEEENGNLITWNYKGNIKMWSVYKDTYQCILEFKLSSKPNKLISLFDNRIMSLGLHDTKLKIWSLNIPRTEEPIETLEIKIEIYFFFYIKERDLLISYLEDKSFCIFNMKNYQVVNRITKIPKLFRSKLYLMDNQRIIIGSNKKMIIVNIVQGRKELEFEFEEDNIKEIKCFLKLRDNETILCGCNDGIFCAYNLMEKKYIYLGAHRFTIGNIENILKIDDTTFISFTFYGEIIFWKY